MQKIYGYLRRACADFDLIEDGDKIAVGVSGGKDSMVLLAGLSGLRRFYGKDFDIAAVTIDPRFGGKDGDYSPVARLCERLGVEYKLVRSDIAEIVFDVRKEPNPCSLCAKMRRGALHDAAKSIGCNKLALGHNTDDALETFIMNLANEGRIGCFMPKTYLSRKDITVIRPMVYAPEYAVTACARRNALEVVASPCPADKSTTRQATKEYLAALEHEHKGIKERLFGAVKRDIWQIKD